MVCDFSRSLVDRVLRRGDQELLTTAQPFPGCTTGFHRVVNTSSPDFSWGEKDFFEIS